MINNGTHSLETFSTSNSGSKGKYIVSIKNLKANVPPVCLKLDKETLKQLTDVIFNRD